MERANTNIRVLIQVAGQGGVGVYITVKMAQCKAYKLDDQLCVCTLLISVMFWLPLSVIPFNN